jgi:phytoene synthase
VTLTPSLEQAFEHCASETRKHAKNFYYAFRLLPPEPRRAMYALYTFCREADDIVDEPGEVGDKRLELAAFGKGLSACMAGEPEGPMYVALAEVCQRYGVSETHLRHVIDGCAMDLETLRYDTYEDLALYLDRVASAVGRATMQVFGIDPAQREAYAVSGGQSVQLTNIIRDVKEDLDRDRIYLPKEDLERFSVTEADLLAGVMTDDLRALMKFQVERARSLYAVARDSLPGEERRRLLPLTAISRIYERVLDQIEARSYDVFAGRARLSGWRKASVGLSTWVRARLGLSIGR